MRLMYKLPEWWPSKAPYIIGDCIEQMKALPAHSIDLLVTDPPFSVTIASYKTRKWFRRNFADLGIVEHFFRDVFTEVERVMKPTGHLYVFCDGQSYPLFWYYMCPFTRSVRELVWDKRVSINGYGWRHQHQLIIFADMPEAKPVPTGDGDVIVCKGVPIDERVHPAQKPVELLKRLIEKSSNEGDVVLDPFLGSGSTLEACIETGRIGLGFETDPSHETAIQGRMKKRATGTRLDV